MGNKCNTLLAIGMHLMSIVLDVPCRGTSVPHGGHNFRLMALCHGGALLHSKDNTMFIKHFKPWAKIIRARFFTKHLLLNIMYFAICIFIKRFASMKAYVNILTCPIEYRRWHVL